MPRVKIRRIPEFREVIYSEEHWKLLRELRLLALRVMSVFTSSGIEVWLHGSVARGDVSGDSDVDIVIPMKIQGYLVEYLLEKNNYKPRTRYIVVATPTTTPKAVIVLDDYERLIVSFPLLDFKPRELEFYKFGGYVKYTDLLEDKRVPGVNKSLVLIKPTKRGHEELPVIGWEDYVAKLLGVSIETVTERVKILTRRDEIGRTGIYAKIALLPDESFEEALERLLKERQLLYRKFMTLEE
ncbi:MAG: nucleotidyltransferase domain-containing protein [Desulfurococcaceae archaeon]|nr:nucleotidyltransferase domain-containing protein [Desulfurococcaceae archaeon]